MNRSVLKTIFFAIIISLLTLSLILNPKASFEASVRGLNMWWEIVFPSLLPFMIISELLIGFGVVAFIGVWLEPFMRPLFRVPGVGGFVWAMGMASGYPSGAKLTVRLRQEGQISRIEGERLVSFTNSSNPLFIFGAIAVGFFHNPKLGIILAAAHYLGNFCVGLVMRFHGDHSQSSSAVSSKPTRLSLTRAIREMHKTRMKHNKPLGKLLGDAVLSSIQTLLMVGGFLILFSVLNSMLSLVSITAVLAAIISIVLGILDISKDLSYPLISGLFEITLGGKLTSEIKNVPLVDQIIVTSFFLAFSGFSVQAQVASILAETDIRFKPFFIARILHGTFAAFIAFLLWNPLNKQLGGFEGATNDLPVFAPIIREGLWENIISAFQLYGPLFTIFMLWIYVILLFNKTRRKTFAP
ncbi:sporulation integral membrane protein YlbJ [Sutcliffiella rhizosphaerae]|uniref:Sporulation integral membrane protein YlbJ n=1 Tax=Sutcliffiella rhizosphaerae TaxID=2880967 RepID=A0ABM8YIW0_9BACI|nr:sporulation integral membrane protein YlbJ [Sutcliffiella rhizosphaerae]CAG9619828.1 Sporulation integral membrane protein YlbJ [Sutcliffiella rhizosphaerae]